MATVAADLRQTAREAVARLARRRGVPDLPEYAPGWNQAFITAIHDFKELFRASPDLEPALRIVAEQLYGKDIHWALELIQNADDAGAHKITFVFSQEEVRVINDGTRFSAADVWGLCSVGHSQKKNKIGFFGIGFKSVYLVSELPEVRSGPYALQLHDKIYPSPLPLDHRAGPSGAEFVLPVKHDQRSRIAEMVHHLTSGDLLHLLLTLDNVRSLEVVDRISGMHGRFYREHVRRDPKRHWDEYRIGATWPGFEEQIWRRYKFNDSRVPPGIAREGREFSAGDRTQIVLARPADGKVRDTQIHCFLPVDVRSELRWLVQSDLDPTPGRERLRENTWNKWLFGEVGKDIARAVYWEVREGTVPWPLIPLREEVHDELQLIAYDTAIESLKSLRFLRTVRGWREPSRVAWPAYARLRDIVRDSDLAATEAGASYLSPSLLPSPASSEHRRSLGVLRELGAAPITCRNLIDLLRRGDKDFYRGGRTGDWWLIALDLLREHATRDELESLRDVACIPVQGSRRRIAPAPAVGLDGYLIAFSRTNNLRDLRAYFGDSDVYLVDRGVASRSPRARRRRPDENDEIRERVRDFLIAEPFHVAREAGPYHVVRDLVLPRMAALAEHKDLQLDQASRLWDMVEYTRQKWPSYVSEYRRFRNKTASETAVAADLADKFRVAAKVLEGGRRKRRAVAVSETYIPSSLLGWDGMDVVLAGIEGIPIVDTVDQRGMPSPARAQRRRGQPPSPSSFLRLLGACVGPKVVKAEPRWEVAHDVIGTECPWIDWTAVSAKYPDSRGRRKGLAGDWTSPDLDKLRARWGSFAEHEQRRRGRALWDSIQADWERLSPTARARIAYFFYTWKVTDLQFLATWIGHLSCMCWLESEDGRLRRPADLVIDTKPNRHVLANDESGRIAWPAIQPDAVSALGVRSEPAPETALTTLKELHAGIIQASTDDTLVIARACYDLLARATRPDNQDENRERLTRMLTRAFSLKGQDGLVFAPPRFGQGGRSWWAPTRVVIEITENEVNTTGPYLGYLGGRYSRATGLWNVLRVERVLTPVLIERAIRDLSQESAELPASCEWYGRLVAGLERLVEGQPGACATRPPRALTENGWAPAETTLWTRRPEIKGSFGSQVNWWRPGSRDSSSVRHSAEYLGIQEIKGDSGSALATSVALREEWYGMRSEPVCEDLRSRWQQALRAWPGAVEAAGDSDGSRDSEIWDALVRLIPERAPNMTGTLTLVYASGGEIQCHAEPDMLVRLEERLFLVRDDALLFSWPAAETLAAHAPVPSLQAAQALFTLLTAARDEPEVLDEQSRRFVRPSITMHVPESPEPVDEPEDEVDVSVQRTSAPRKRVERKEPEVAPPPEAAPILLADVDQFEPGIITRIDSSSTPRASPTRFVEPGATQGSRRQSGERERSRPKPKQRYSNSDTENAAAGFVAEFEWRRGEFQLTRRPPGFGSDYTSEKNGVIDRYIEIKSFGGASEEFSMTASERRAAMKPVIADEYWVYVVEHLRDEQEPIVTAIRNPVCDTRVLQEPQGGIVVRSWRSATEQLSLPFHRLIDVESEEDDNFDKQPKT